MIQVILHGCNGRMGRYISDLAAQEEDIQIVAGIDSVTTSNYDYPVFATLQECHIEADIIIDFSTASACDALLDYCEEKKLPLVLCTTALSGQQLARVENLSHSIAILRSANMSLGINTLIKLLQTAAGILAKAGYDVEIVEKHHNQKLDAPSGTALSLADAINASLDTEYTYVYDRSQRRQKRDLHEIGISAVRGGSIVGEHEVIFAGPDEVITLSHTAYSRAVFAKGALQAARFLAGQSAGLYDMSNVVG